MSDDAALFADMLRARFDTVERGIEKLREEGQAGRSRVYERANEISASVHRLESRITELEAQIATQADTAAFSNEVLHKAVGVEARLAAAERLANEVPELRAKIARHESAWARVAAWSLAISGIGGLVGWAVQSAFGPDLAAQWKRWLAGA